MRAALLLLATHTAAAATLQPTVKPALAQNHKLQLAPDPVATIVTLRGGASLGPITPTVGAWLQVVLEAYVRAPSHLLPHVCSLTRAPSRVLPHACSLTRAPAAAAVPRRLPRACPSSSR